MERRNNELYHYGIKRRSGRCSYGSDEEYLTGAVLNAIDKKTGRTFLYDLTSDIDAYYNATSIEVDTIWDHKI